MALQNLKKFRYEPYSGSLPRSRDTNQTADAETESSISPPQSVSEELQAAVIESDYKVLGLLRYPLGHKARKAYRTPSGKTLTAYQWKVYDHIINIPDGKVTTYKDVAAAIGGSARAAGTALSKNPFSPHVPCHRVITSNLSIGGFCGQKNDTKGLDNPAHPLIEKKKALLAAEGIKFDSNGYLCQRSQVVGTDFAAVG